jgi:hypothetical protein
VVDVHRNGAPCSLLNLRLEHRVQSAAIGWLDPQLSPTLMVSFCWAAEPPLPGCRPPLANALPAITATARTVKRTRFALFIFSS